MLTFPTMSPYSNNCNRDLCETHGSNYVSSTSKPVSSKTVIELYLIEHPLLTLILLCKLQMFFFCALTVVFPSKYLITLLPLSFPF